jgi:hypothetical protein
LYSHTRSTALCHHTHFAINIVIIVIFQELEKHGLQEVQAKLNGDLGSLTVDDVDALVKAIHW